MLSPYFHLSLDYNLSGIWAPRSPKGFETVKDAKGYGPTMTEPSTPRICLSPSIEGCFYALYPNLYPLFEVKGYKSLDFCLYRAYIDDEDPMFVNNARIVTDHIVWDAHVTKEVWYLDKLEMNRVQKLRITPDLSKKIHANVFNDPQNESRIISAEASIEIVQRYPEFYKR